ncbi:MAG: hypothetical protein V1835_04970 [Candidatus Micrarchaeota archaeon]
MESKIENPKKMDAGMENSTNGGPVSGEKGAQLDGNASEDSSKIKTKRTGKTAEHYKKQKSQAFSYFRIDSSDLHKMESSEFTIYNFITNSFAFSQTKKELTIKVLEELKKEPMAFIALQKKLQAKKSTLYMLIIALQKSGLVTDAEKNGALRLSSSFSDMLKLYSEWWGRWLARE